MSMGSKALKWDLLGVKINLPSIRKDEILAGERSPTRMMEILAWKFGENLFSLCSFKEQAGENARRSVSRVLFPPKRAMAIHLGRPSPDASRDPPGRRRGNPPAGRNPLCRPYSVLLPVGFALPPPLPEARCALTAPFHPYPPKAGGLLSVALSLGSPPPGVTRHRVSVEPGLSSPRGVSPIAKGGHPTVWQGIVGGRKGTGQEKPREPDVSRPARGLR